MVCEVILEFGTEEQKRRYITLITSEDGYRSILETGRGKPRQLWGWPSGRWVMAAKSLSFGL